MPDYRCRDCGCLFDVPEDVNRLEYLCPDCGSGRWAVIPGEAPHVRGDAYDWSSENNGKGRRISQLDYGPRKPFYAKSQQAAIDEGKSRGFKVEKTR
jgi:hypothetical protein